MRRRAPGSQQQFTSATPGPSPFAPWRDENPQSNPFARPYDAAPLTADPFATQASPAVNPFSPGGSSPATTAVPESMPALLHCIGNTPAPVGEQAPAVPAFATPRGTGVAQPVAARVAYVALLVAAAMAAILSAVGVYALTELRDSFDKVLHVDPTGTALFYVSDYADNAELALIGGATMLGIVFAIAYILVARAIRKGRSWPRLVGTGLAILSLPAIALGPVAIAAVLAGVVAVIASWMPSARRYSAAVRARRHA